MNCNICPVILFLKQYFGNDESIKCIKEECAALFGVSVKDLSIQSRKRKYADARRIAMIRCRNETNATLEEIGKAFNRNHSTVIYNIANPPLNSDLQKPQAG